MRVLYAPRTQRDLQIIRQHIEAESRSREIACQFLVRLLDACDALAILPERYAPYRYVVKWRMMPFGRYLVFFQIHGNDVRIGHVRHGARSPFKG